MFQSNGALVKSNTILWEGPVRDWPGTGVFGPDSFQSASYDAMYRTHLWVHATINKRANSAARLPFKVYERMGDEGRIDASTSSFGRLMARPSSYLDPFTFWQWTVTTKDIYGEAPWLKLRDAAKRPVELVPIMPTALVTRLHPMTNDIEWIIRLPKGDIHVKREDLVLHRQFNPLSLFRGMSTLEPLRSTLENEDGARRANSALWRNGGRPSVLLEHPSLLNDGAVKRLSAQWADIHGGVDNWSKAAVLEEGMKATVIPLNNGELQYIEARKLNREEVVAAFDVPPPAVHILDHATYSNITEQNRSLYRDTMGTVLGSLESTIEFELRDGRFGRDQPPDFGDVFYGEFLLDEVLRGAFEARATAYQQADWMTPAEKRQKENLPFIEGTDRLFFNSSTLPLGPDGSLVQPAAPVAPATAPPEPPTAPPGALPAGRGVLVPPATVRAVMGRVARKRSLDDIDARGLVLGIGEDAACAVLHELVAARLVGQSLDDFKARLRALAKETHR